MRTGGTRSKLLFAAMRAIRPLLPLLLVAIVAGCAPPAPKSEQVADRVTLEETADTTDLRLLVPEKDGIVTLRYHLSHKRYQFFQIGFSLVYPDYALLYDCADQEATNLRCELIGRRARTIGGVEEGLSALVTEEYLGAHSTSGISVTLRGKFARSEVTIDPQEVHGFLLAVDQWRVAHPMLSTDVVTVTTSDKAQLARELAAAEAKRKKQRPAKVTKRAAAPARRAPAPAAPSPANPPPATSSGRSIEDLLETYPEPSLTPPPSPAPTSASSRSDSPTASASPIR